MRSLLRRYREPIFVAFVLAASFAVLVSRARPAPLRLVDRLVLAATAPVERLINGVAYLVVDGVTGYVWLHGVREENLRLRREASRLRGEAAKTQELVAENARLRALLDYADKQAPVRMLAAPVLAVGASPHSHLLRIGRGSDDGVQPGAAVVSIDGIVGTISQVTSGYADVQLITSPLSAVPAVSQRTRSRSTVKGSGELSACRLEYALRTDDLQEGDVLVTAGGAGFFPKGMRIGRVAGVTRKPTGMFLSAELLPSADFARLDEVMVVVPEQASAAPLLPAPPAAAPSLRSTALGTRR